MGNTENKKETMINSLWGADPDDNEDNYKAILAWLPEEEQKEIVERADLHIWWQTNESGWILDKEQKALLKHTYILASSQAIASYIEWEEKQQ